MTRYSVACRGSLNTKKAKCWQGGGWLADEPMPPCPRCGEPMFTTATLTVLSITREGLS